MGSVSKRVLKNASRPWRLDVSHLVAEAAARMPSTLECADVTHEAFTELVIGRWKVQCAARLHPDEADDAVEHWHLVLQLHPYRREQWGDDRQELARISSRVAAVSGYTSIAPLRPLTTTFDEAPHAPHHFVWHTYGAALSPEHRRAIIRQLRLLGEP
jgi:hypothetical protein